jgi:hypothetical protein
MTRVHDSAYREPEDIYAANRCANCPHLIYADHKPGDPCLYGAEGCGCTDHRRSEEKPS